MNNFNFSCYPLKPLIEKLITAEGPTNLNINNLPNNYNY